MVAPTRPAVRHGRVVATRGAGVRSPASSWSPRRGPVGAVAANDRQRIAVVGRASARQTGDRRSRDLRSVAARETDRDQSRGSPATLEARHRRCRRSRSPANPTSRSASARAGPATARSPQVRILERPRAAVVHERPWVADAHAISGASPAGQARTTTTALGLTADEQVVAIRRRRSLPPPATAARRATRATAGSEPRGIARQHRGERRAEHREQRDVEADVPEREWNPGDQPRKRIFPNTSRSPRWSRDRTRQSPRSRTPPALRRGAPPAHAGPPDSRTTRAAGARHPSTHLRRSSPAAARGRRD